MISTSVFASLRPLPARTQFRVAGRCLVALSSPTYVRYASHKSSKAMKAMKSLKKTEPAKPSVPKPSVPKISLPKPTVPKPSVPKPTVPKAKTTRPAPTKEAAKSQEPSVAITPESYILLEQQLGSKAGPTVLYRKSHWKLVLGCYAMTATGIWAGLDYYYVNIMAPVGVPNWVTWTHYVGVFFISIGVVITFMYPARMIRSIHAIPYRPTPESLPSIKLQIQSNNILSFLPAIKTEAPLNEICLGRKLSLSRQPVQEEIPEGAFAKFVHALSTGPSRIFYSLKSTLTKERIVPVTVKSSFLRFKLRDDGWQWERRGLDRLIGTDKKW
ncbi:hypothetical protein BGX38DRAFT_1333766 [Terfezia claveryi]|nr:hypothetical protein BGX38DRAFT_1333766 [Terfezia claveryi]